MEAGSRRALGIALLVGTLALLSHAPAPRNAFAWDDREEIEDNTVLSQPFALRTLFLSQYMGPTSQTGWYRPVPLTVQKILFDRYGTDPRPYHTVVLAIHVVLAGALAWFLATEGLAWGALIVGALFAVHTVHTESAGAAYGLKEVLAGAFSFAALIALARWKEGAPWSRLLRLLATGLFVSLAILSKESAAPVPAALIASDLLRGAPLRGWLDALRRNGRPALFHGAFLATAAFAATSMRFPAVGGILLRTPFDSVTNPLVGLAQPARLGLGLRVAALYGRMLVWPLPFSPTYATGAVAVPRSPLDLGVIVGAILVAALFAAVVLAPRMRGPAGVGAVWAGATYLLASNLVLPFSTLMSERFLYLPSLGLAMMAAPGLDGLAREALRRTKDAPLRRSALVALVLVPILALGALTFVRTPVFGSDPDLMAAAYRWYPGGALARLARADRLSVEGHYDEADAALRQLLEDHPGLPLCEQTLAENAQAKGDREAAHRWWERAIRHPAAEVGTFHGYAELVAREGRDADVVRLLTEGIRTGRGNAVSTARAREMRGSYLLRAGRTLQGLADLRLACALGPGLPAAWEDLAGALLPSDPSGAEAALRRAITIAPNRTSALRSLSRLLLGQRRGAEAVPFLQRLTVLDGADLQARSDLGTALAQSGRIPEAEAVFAELLARDPAHPVALATLGSIRESQGRREEAAALYERFLAAAPPDSPVIETVRGRLARLRGAP